MERALQPEQEPDRARRDLSGHRDTRGVGLVEQLELSPVPVAAYLDEGERQRAPGFLRHAPEDRELGVDVGEVGDHLQHAPAGRTDRPGDAHQLVGLGGQGGRVLTATRAVVQRARRREPQCTGFDRAVREIAHRRDVVGGGALAPRTPLPHHVQPQRSVRHLQRHVDIERSRAERVRNSGNDPQFHARPSCSTVPGMSSTPSINSMRRS